MNQTLATQAINETLQKLLNKKHLYQSVEVDFRPSIKEDAIELHLRRIAWTVANNQAAQRPSLDEIENEILDEICTYSWGFEVGLSVNKIISFILLPIKTPCSVCDGIESFNTCPGKSPVHSFSLGFAEQVFVFPLECQSCKSSVIVFLVKRTRDKIQIVGRSELENVKPPSYIPKAQRRFYSEAIIDFQCNSVLSSLFMLRTLIEQHMRAVTERPGLRGDELCDAYNKTLSSDFHSRFPSLGAAYRELSGAIHRADEDAQMFETQLQNIEEHFDALVIYRKSERQKK